MIDCKINNYYQEHIKAILTIINNSYNGKRIWTEDGYGHKDYSQSYESTYPEYMKFYFVKTPKKLRHLFCEEGREAWKEGYFNGSTNKLVKLFENAIKGKMPRSERMLYIFDTILEGYFEELKEIEFLEANVVF